MCSSLEEGSTQSSESVVSSLLANQTERSFTDASIWYKDEQYNSATKALEAYIEDFEQSLLSPDVSTGKLYLKTGLVKYDGLSRSLDLLKGGSQDTFSAEELEFIHQPLRKGLASDPDLVSLTTDDLLALPSDGSLPITHTSTLKTTPCQNFNHDRKKPICPRQEKSSSLCLSKKSHIHFVENSATLDKKSLSSLSHKDFGLKYSMELYGHKGTSPLVPPFSAGLESHTLKLNNVSSYPRWITSQKSDLDVSGITSIPDLSYPVWLNEGEFLSDSDAYNGTSTSQKQKDWCSHVKTNFKSTLWAEELDSEISSSSHDDDVFGSSDETQMLSGRKHIENDRYLKSGQFSRTVGVPELKENFLHKDLNDLDFKKSFEDDQIELLILKAERALESSSTGLAYGMLNSGSPRTEDILDGDRSWEKTVAPFKSPVPVLMSEDDHLKTKSDLSNKLLQDCSKSDCQKSTLSGGNHPGPVEALKQMLFNLQLVQQKLHVGQEDGVCREPEKGFPPLGTT
ncbi:lung adenoma susceptibility protein 2 isoform X2 [Protopterus annectens]|uniref:lung adenoma susceptibility protein 2 isoform X2 n=1 Tax=Protopterus annectens TaxID=7888 RepID=UPI001CF9C07B|nr:lung adenoma susceptibility protein 2 isoform X2 [Protopterus annectens]